LPSIKDTPVRRALGGKAESYDDLSEGNNTTYHVTMVDGTGGVYKPAAGEKKNLRPNVKGHYWSREVAVSDVAEILGLDDLVPTTVENDINLPGMETGGVGSVQRFMSGAKVALKLKPEKRYGKNTADHGRAAAFDYLIGNNDRHAGNWMVKAGKIILIDNALSFPDKHEPSKGMFSMCDKAEAVDLPIPPEVKNWGAKWPQVKALLQRRGMSDTEIDLTRTRLTHLLRHDTFKSLKEELAGPTNLVWSRK
jgi:hypothetical protein